MRRRDGGPSPGTAASLRPRPPPSLTIYGAASLKGALEEAKTAYEAANPGTTLTISTDSSAALETQIEQGAPADVFLSADTTNPKKLVDAGPRRRCSRRLRRQRADDHRRRPTTRAASTRRTTSAKPGVRVIAAGDEVPITKYATQLVDNLAAAAGDPADFAAAYAANVVSKEDNVKAVVGPRSSWARATRAIVYVTDATASDKVATIDVPDDVNVPATLRRRRRQGVAERRRRARVPRLARRAGRPGDPRRVRVPAAAVMTDAVGERASPTGGAARRAQPARSAGASVGCWSSPALFAVFLALPVVTLVVRAVVDGSLRGDRRLVGGPRRARA